MTGFADGVRVGSRKGYHLGQAPKSWLVTLSHVPVILDRDGLAQAQQLGAAGNLTMNGALVTGGVGIFDVPRCVGFYSAADLSLINFSAFGYDEYGYPVMGTVAGPNNSTVIVPKAMKRIVRLSADAAVGLNVEVGSTDRFGLPVRINSVTEVVHVGWAGTLARDAATFVAGDTTSPATAATTDIRGTVVPSSASNGSRRLSLVLIADMTSKATQFGVRQFSTGV